jgi:methylenetetrahydrofolate reductase (NADPH)
MAKLEPMFVDITWGAGGSTTDLTLELASNFQQQFNLETQMHLTCTNISKESVADALVKARAAGIRNILCLRGDPPHGQEKWAAVEGGFNNAVDLVRYVREQHGDWFGISVAGYPEGHIDWFKEGEVSEIAREDYMKDLQYLKDKVEAGADCIITQLFYDVDLYLKWVQDCRDIGISVPIIPGIMPIGTYAGFFRMTGFCKTKIPTALRDGLEAVKDNEDAVKEFGVQVVTDMCRRLLDAGAPGLHLYTLNLEKSSIEILGNLGMLEGASERKALPWRANIKGKSEGVRPIFWANRPRSYNHRTEHWDEYPNGRWGDSRWPGFGELTDYHLTKIHAADENDNRIAFGAELTSVQDVNGIFAKFLRSEIKRLPWCAELVKETSPIKFSLARICEAGMLTINSQPAVNGVPSAHAVHGWGGVGGVVYQKAYVEFFCSGAILDGIRSALAMYKSVQYSAVDMKGAFETSSKTNVTAVTWGVFPDREILQVHSVLLIASLPSALLLVFSGARISV